MITPALTEPVKARGRIERVDGQDRFIGKDIIEHGLCTIARGIAMGWPGRRTPEQECKAPDKLIHRHSPTPPGRAIDLHFGEVRTLHISRLEALNGDCSTTRALEARTIELKRVDLADEVRPGVLIFEVGWQVRLGVMDLRLCIRRRHVQERQLRREQVRARSGASLV